MHGDVRLAGGQTANEGRVEICISNQWSTVCGYLALSLGDVYGWTLSEALVTCKQLGFDGTIIYHQILVTRIMQVEILYQDMVEELAAILIPSPV